MYKHQNKLRVRYSETDKMGVVYYGNYAQYFEIGRVELMRNIGVVYDELEKEGIMMPVVHFEMDFKSPAVYDEELTVETIIDTMPSTKMVFKHKVIGAKGNLVCSGEVILVFINNDFKPTRVPSKMKEALEKVGVPL